MPEIYKIRVKRGDLEVEVESTDKDFVETKIEQYLGKTVAANTQHQDQQPPPPAQQNRRPLSISEFIKKVVPDKKNEIAATLAYFLEYYEDTSEWKPEAISDKFTDVRKSKPANMTDLLKKSDFFMKGHEAGFYQLSETGVQWAEGRLKNA